MKAVQLGAQQIALGDAEVVLAGGMENMTRVPFLLDRMRPRLPDRRCQVVDAMYRDGLLDPLCGLLMGETAREPRRPLRALARGAGRVRLGVPAEGGGRRRGRAAEMIPVEVTTSGKGTTTVSEDEHPRPETTLEGLAAISPGLP